MSDILETLIELRPNYIQEVMDLSAANLTDVEFKWLPQKKVNKTYFDYFAYRGAEGMMLPAHPDAEPPDINMGQGTLYRVTGFHFKERSKVTSSELTELYQADPTYRKLFMVDKIDWILQRAKVRIKKLIWDAFRGSIAIAENGQNYSLSYSVQTGSVLADWSDPTSNILGDIETWITLLSAVGATARWLVLNSKTYSYLKYNNNIVSLITGAGIIRKNEGVRSVIEDMGLNIVIVDDTYETESGGTYTSHKFVADNEVFVIGEGGYRLGNFVYLVDPNTTTLGKLGKPGFWSETYNHLDQNPKWVEIVGGFTGVPAIYFPDRIVNVADVTTP